MVINFNYMIKHSTHRAKNLHTLLVKYYNDYLDRQCSGRGRGGGIYLQVEDAFCYALGTSYADMQQNLLLTRARERLKLSIVVKLLHVALTKICSNNYNKNVKL